jgi:hypothetical protein
MRSLKNLRNLSPETWQKTRILRLTDVCDKYPTIFNKDTGHLSYSMTSLKTLQ